jgi:hypothetical protein
VWNHPDCCLSIAALGCSEGSPWPNLLPPMFMNLLWVTLRAAIGTFPLDLAMLVNLVGTGNNEVAVLGWESRGIIRALGAMLEP